MMESNILADNVVKNFLNRDISLNIENLFTRELNILADNVAENFLHRKISQDTEDLFMNESTGGSCKTQLNLIFREALKKVINWDWHELQLCSESPFKSKSVFRKINWDWHEHLRYSQNPNLTSTKPQLNYHSS